MAPPIYVGTTELSNLYLQSTGLSAVYVGTTQIYPSSSPSYVTSGLNVYLDARDLLTTNQTTWPDRSGNNLPFTIANGTISVANYWRCNAIPDVVYRNSYTMGSAFSMEVYGNTFVGVSQYSMMMGLYVFSGNYAGYYLGTNGANNQIRYWANTNYTANIVFTPTSNYKHVVFTGDGTNLNVYINGVLASTNNGGQNITSLTDTFRMGHSQNLGASEYVSGYYQILRIYNKALTQAEVTQNYNYNVSVFG